MDLKIHHVGYVVSDIDQYAANFPCGNVINRVFDPLQDADLAVYELSNAMIEFIEPKSSNSFTYEFLKQNGQGIHHICYETTSMQHINSLILENKMIKVRGPMKAILFGREVVFAMTRQKALIEFIVV